DRETGQRSHHQFRDLPQFLRPHDCLVVNNTRVVPARLRGIRDLTGGKWEGLFLKLTTCGAWEVIGQTRGKIQPGETVSLLSPLGEAQFQIRLQERLADGRWQVEPIMKADPLLTTWEILDQFGSIPLPPYIRHGEAEQTDRERYQTVYAEHPGAAAAPTAGLHFTPELLAQCRSKGVQVANVTLHVGLGTFRPVAVEKLDEHQMHSEWCEVPAATVEAIIKAKQQGGRVIAVGTTSVRSLETAALSGVLQVWSGESELFIRPGFCFHVVDALITNFHLPRSTLLVMLSAFAGYNNLMAAYQDAIENRYRFFSYGDAMLVE
ncbi:MAG: tRNA preQ1(34) S-adenosylmethionine ribosyltransferase-isomerase QueA, partial [Planctomycetaceae bacterium]|nr:tRNA preQ1(34) S-adenosylmethionine ribosyltransferase-isomerase QueA [Planctomycetaceae bacterium]